MTLRPAFLALALAAAGGAHATSDAELAALVDQRLLGDRTGACFAAAVIDGDSVARTWRCADPSETGRIGPDVAFEIGSIAKTMTATLLADLIVQGRASLDDPLADYLPEGTAVPEYEGRPILLRHVVTHTSGLPALPSRMTPDDIANPYATLTADELFASLEDVILASAPGTRFEYSNFASMLLSWAVAHRAGQDFETLARERLFSPLGMAHAHVAQPPPGVRAATGHLSNGQETSAWDIATDLAGVGGVRATLDDMVRYAQAQIAAVDAPIAEAIALAQQPVETEAGQPIAMNWMLSPLGGRTVHGHGGGTGGFSSFMVFDRERDRAVVVLSDTTLHTLGGLADLGNHLLDDSLPLGQARVPVQAPAELIDALVGEYRLQGGLAMSVGREGDALTVQAAGQPVLNMRYDSAGEFYLPELADARLVPRERGDGRQAFVWHQGGGALAATPADGDAGSAPAPDAAALRAYAGTYPLAPGFELTVRERGGLLHAQATGQGEFPLVFTDADVFEAAAYGIEIRFQRGEDGAVEALELHQGGRVTRGERTAAADDGAGPAAEDAPAGPAPDAEALRAYAGSYPLMRGFELAVRERGGVLHAQATGQGEFPLTPAGEDVFRAPAYGIEIRFQRGGDGAVEALELHQGGQVTRGERR